MDMTVGGITAKKEPERTAEVMAAVYLARAAKAQGLSLMGADGLAKQFNQERAGDRDLWGND